MLNTFLEQLALISGIEWLAMVTGIVGVWLSIKEKIGAWPLFIICYASYVYISYQFGLHAFMGMNIAFIGISIYGWFKWSSSSSERMEVAHISRTPTKHLVVAALLLCIGTLAIGKTLQITGEAYMPYLDAFATCCGFIAQWMLSRKHVETWALWIVTDIIYIGLLGSQGSWSSVVLFSIFILLAIKGGRDWLKLLAAKNTPLQIAAQS
jgi:nicotinamide mononucleotide transporter